MATALALGGENFTGGVIQPRFPQKPSTLDAITGIAGAGPSIATDYGRGLYEMVTGNIGEGAGKVLKSLPYARIWLWKDEVNQMSRGLGGELDSNCALQMIKHMRSFALNNGANYDH
jgi:hypothetical protein